jgi:outer membrane protein
VGTASTSLFTGSASNNFNGTVRNATVGVQLSYPLFTNGLNDAKVRESLASIDKSRFDLETARRGVGLATRTAYLGVTNGIASTRAQLQALTSANTVLASTKLGLEVGVRTNLDILNAQQAVFSVRRDLAAARYNTLVGGLRLKAMAGELAEPDVQAVNAYLTP